MTLVPYELNAGVGGITLVGRDPGADEVRAGRPFVGASGRLLEDCMVEAGLTRERVNILNVSRERPPGNVFAAHARESLDAEVRELHATLRRLKPRVIVALGNEACHAIIPEWPDARREGRLTHLGDIKRACDIENRRGYVFDSPFGPVVATVHPAFVVCTWTPWRVLLSYDLQRAQEIARDGLVRPTRNVDIIGSSSDMRRAVDALRRARVFSCDIETRADLSVACVGFAGSSGKAYVFPSQYLDGAKALLGDANLTAIFANGIYDMFVLKHREGWNIRTRIEDVQVLWHAMYAELAGAKESKRGAHRFTRKSLAFLASMYTFDEWWKATYTNEQEFLEYNGKDCSITLDVWEKMQPHAEHARAAYEHERSLMWPCVDMLARGLRVNDALRCERVEALTAASAETRAQGNNLVLPLLEREIDALRASDAAHLFEETDGVCPCCRSAKKKQGACWSCAGFSKAPSKKAMREAGIEALGTCKVCGGVPRATRLVINLNSNEQVKTILYDVLRLPKRFTKNTKGESVLTTDEATLKGLLGGIPT